MDTLSNYFYFYFRLDHFDYSLKLTKLQLRWPFKPYRAVTILLFPTPTLVTGLDIFDSVVISDAINFSVSLLNISLTDFLSNV